MMAYSRRSFIDFILFRDRDSVSIALSAVGWALTLVLVYVWATS
jgi:hypothetical protein